MGKRIQTGTLQKRKLKWLRYFEQKYPDLFVFQFSSVQLLSRVRLFVTPWIAARQPPCPITNSRSLLKLMSIELVMPSSHLILCRPLLLVPQIPHRIRVFETQKSKQLGIILYLSTTKQGKAGLSIPEDVVWGSHSGTQPGGILHGICVPCDLASPLKRVCMLSQFSCVRLIVTPWTTAHQAPLSMGFSRQEYWSGLPFPSPGDLPHPGREHESLTSPGLLRWQVGPLLLATPGKPPQGVNLN